MERIQQVGATYRNALSPSLSSIFFTLAAVFRALDDTGVSFIFESSLWYASLNCFGYFRDSW
jgi:hypothetical protein